VSVGSDCIRIWTFRCVGDTSGLRLRRGLRPEDATVQPGPTIWIVSVWVAARADRLTFGARSR
jgi:hypothetical protein